MKNYLTTFAIAMGLMVTPFAMTAAPADDKMDKDKMADGKMDKMDHGKMKKDKKKKDKMDKMEKKSNAPAG